MTLRDILLHDQQAWNAWNMEHKKLLKFIYSSMIY